MSSLKTLLAIAPNGARKTKKEHAELPITSKEIGRCAKQCLEAGAGMIHLHVRDKNQKHSLEVSDYKQAIQQIRKQTGDELFIQVTSEAVGIYTPEEQFAMIHALKPPAVSIGLREIKGLDEKEITQHFIKMRRANIFPQLILYNATDLALYMNWIERGVLIGSAYPLLYVVGKKKHLEGAFESSDLDGFTNLNSHWMVCAFGAQEFKVSQIASDLGGHVRLGFENNCLLKSAEPAKNNAELISQMRDYLAVNNKSIATASDAQELMQPDW